MKTEYWLFILTLSYLINTCLGCYFVFNNSKFLGYLHAAIASVSAGIWFYMRSMYGS